MASSGSALQRSLSASATLADALPEVAAELAKLHEEISSLKHDKVGHWCVVRSSWFYHSVGCQGLPPCKQALLLLLRLWLSSFVFFEQEMLQQQVTMLQSRCDEQQLELMRRSLAPGACPLCPALCLMADIPTSCDFTFILACADHRGAEVSPELVTKDETGACSASVQVLSDGFWLVLLQCCGLPHMCVGILFEIEPVGCHQGAAGPPASHALAQGTIMFLSALSSESG